MGQRGGVEDMTIICTSIEERGSEGEKEMSHVLQKYYKVKLFQKVCPLLNLR